MGKKKFIEKKKSATFRLVFKDSSSEGFGDGSDRVFMRVDRGDAHVPGFDDDGESSIFDDAEEEEEEEEVEAPSHGKRPPLQLIMRGRTVGSGADPVDRRSDISEHVRRELVELGFPDDGYNYLQHLREVGPSGRTGSFVPNNHFRLDLRPDVKAYDASKLCVFSSMEDSDNDALLVIGSTSRIRGPTAKVVDSDVVALLEEEDDHSPVSADELEDDFIAMANKSGENLTVRESGSVQHALERPNFGGESLDVSKEFEGDDDGYERPSCFLDEQFELLALREYEDDEIGELDYEDPSARGPASISKFDNVMSDFLIKSSLVHDKYQTPAEIEHNNDGGTFKSQQCGHMEKTQNNDKEKEGCLFLLNTVNKTSLIVDTMFYQSDLSDKAKELIAACDTDEDEGQWDCETVVTTYSNLDNHPAKIYFSPREASKGISSIGAGMTEANGSVIRLRGKQQLPIDYLHEKSRLNRDEKKKAFNHNQNSMDVQEMKSCAGRRKAGETKEERKARKAAVKEEKRAARAVKKETKLLYKDESQHAQHIAASTGPSTVHLS